MQLLENISLRKKLLSVTLLVTTGFIILISLHLRELSHHLHDDIATKTQHLVESAHSVLVYYENEEKSGRLTQKQAQERATDVIKHLHYDGKEYFWINDMHAKMIMHPYKPELNGKDISNYKDPQGKYLFIEMITTVKAHGAGFVSYMWPKPNETEPTPKISYVKGFLPWGWIIGSGVYVDSITKHVNKALRADIINASITVLIILMITTLISKEVISSAKNIIHVMHQLAAGNYTITIPSLHRQDEMGQIARSIEVFRVQTMRIREIQEHVDRTKSEFLSNMSHELRTPMHAILNYCSMTIKRLDGDAPDERALKYLNNIHIAGERLLRIINDLLDLSKMESGKMSYNFQPYDLRESVNEAEIELSTLIKNKQLQLNIRSDHSPSFQAKMDKHRIMQVLVNLLANAIRYSPEETSIDIHLSTRSGNTPSEPTMLVCSITDQGAGIPEDELEAIFDKFVQSSKTDQKTGGTGLGLSICRQIITAHEGNIWAEHGEHGGAVFIFTLPALPLA